MAAMTAAMALFSINDALVKYFGSSLPVAQSIAVRGAIATAATLIIVALARQTSVIAHAFHPIILLRGLCECAAIFCLIYSLSYLSIGDVTAISQISPLMLLPIAVLIFHERVSVWHWLLALAGFVGVALIAKFGAAGFDPTIGFALLTAIGFALRDILARQAPKEIPALAVALSTVAVVAAVGAAVAAYRGFAPIRPDQVIGLGAAGLLLAIGQALVFLAFRWASVSDAAPFSYAKTLFGAAIGFFIFAERPDALTLVGMLLVIASGVGVAWATTARLPR